MRNRFPRAILPSPPYGANEISGLPRSFISFSQLRSRTKVVPARFRGGKNRKGGKERKRRHLDGSGESVCRQIIRPLPFSLQAARLRKVMGGIICSFSPVWFTAPPPFKGGEGGTTYVVSRVRKRMPLLSCLLPRLGDKYLAFLPPLLLGKWERKERTYSFGLKGGGGGGQDPLPSLPLT